MPHKPAQARSAARRDARPGPSGPRPAKPAGSVRAAARRDAGAAPAGCGSPANAGMWEPARARQARTKTGPGRLALPRRRGAPPRAWGGGRRCTCTVMQQRDAKPAPQGRPKTTPPFSSGPQLPVGPALDAQAFTLRRRRRAFPPAAAGSIIAPLGPRRKRDARGKAGSWRERAGDALQAFSPSRPAGRRDPARRDSGVLPRAIGNRRPDAGR